MEPVARRPRNAKLSAYYGLKNQPSDDSSLADASPRPNGEGSWAPNDLIKRLPLERLVRASTKIRGESEKIERSLHGSVRRCYEQVDAAAKECGQLRTVCSTLGGTDGALTRVARSCDGCVKISDEMGPLRERIEGLEESRRVMLLLRASEVLAQQLPAQFTELTGLCTDPVNARDRLFLTAHRCAIIVPQLATLSNDKSSFKDAHTALTNAIKETVAELITQVEEEKGSIEGLSISDVLRIRLFLGIDDEELRTFFLQTSEDILRSTMPETSAACISGNSGLNRGSFQIRHAANVMLEDIKAISCAYDDAFRGNQSFVALSKKRSGETYGDETVLSSQDFALWLSGTVDELIGSVVRKEVATPEKVSSSKILRVSLEDSKAEKDDEEEQISMADLSDFQDAVGELRKRASTDVPGADTSIAQVPIIIGALADSICSHVKRTITGQASAQMVGMLDDALFSEFPDYDNPSLESRTMRELRKVVTRIEELGESCDTLLKELTSNASNVESQNTTSEVSFQMEILGLVVRKAMTGPEFNRKEMWFQAMLRGAFICEQVAKTVRSEALKQSLTQETESLREAFTCKVVEAASDSFRGLLYPEEKEEQLDVMISGGSTMADRIVNLLVQGRKEVDLYPTIGSSLHDVWRDVRNVGSSSNNGYNMNSSMDLLDTQGIDSDGVLLRIAENWVQYVRMATLTKDRFSAVESLVTTMHERLSNRDTFHIVSRAANERCIEL